LGWGRVGFFYFFGVLILFRTLSIETYYYTQFLYILFIKIHLKFKYRDILPYTVSLYRILYNIFIFGRELVAIEPFAIQPQNLYFYLYMESRDNEHAVDGDDDSTEFDWINSKEKS
jgi:hypothetical protein